MLICYNKECEPKQIRLVPEELTIEGEVDSLEYTFATGRSSNGSIGIALSLSVPSLEDLPTKGGESPLVIVASDKVPI